MWHKTIVSADVVHHIYDITVTSQLPMCLGQFGTMTSHHREYTIKYSEDEDHKIPYLPPP